MNPSWYTANQPLCLGGQIYMWNRYAQCEKIVHMDTAQFTKFGHQSRIEILDRKGTALPLIWPLKDRAFKPINEVLLADPERTWAKLRRSLEMAYSRAPYFEYLMGPLDFVVGNTVQEEGVSLAHLNLTVFVFLKEMLHLPLEQHWTSKMGPRPEHPSEWVASMGAAIDCTTYLGGGTAQKAYLREEDFQARGMKFVAQDYVMPAYARGKNAPNDNAMISILDPLMWLGPLGTQLLIGVR